VSKHLVFETEGSSHLYFLLFIHYFNIYLALFDSNKYLSVFSDEGDFPEVRWHFERVQDPFKMSPYLREASFVFARKKSFFESAFPLLALLMLLAHIKYSLLR
jgi:hypothetical protein